MHFLYKAAVIWVLSLIAAGPIPLALHVALCHGHDGIHGHFEPTACSHHHHAHGSHASHSHADDGIALTAGGHDHECSVCQTLSQTVSIDAVSHELNSQLFVQPAIVAFDDVYTAAVCTSYQVRGPPCSLLV